MEAWLCGGVTDPVVVLRFGFAERHATTGQLLRDWVKELPDRRWDQPTGTWHVTGFGTWPDQVLLAAGAWLVGLDGRLATANDRCCPLAVPLDGDPDGLWRIHPRLAGTDNTARRLPSGALFDRDRGCWLVHPASLDDDTWLEAWPGWAEARATGTAPKASAAPLGFDGTITALFGIGLERLAGTTAVERQAMQACGIGSVGDLLHTVPRRHQDFTRPVLLRDAAVGDEVCLVATVASATLDRSTGNLKASVVDDAGTRLTATWWRTGRNQAGVVTAGARLVLMGRLGEFTTTSGHHVLTMGNPTVGPLDASDLGRVVGIYPQSPSKGLDTFMVKRAAREAVDRLGPMVEPFDPGLAAAHGLPDRATALRDLHSPARLDDVGPARDRLAWDELLRYQLVIAARRAERAAQPSTSSPDRSLADRWLASLPFAPTGAQQRAIDDVATDMAAGQPMERLLLGDVGTGKTAVATHAVLVAVGSGHQAALMAPTDVLASQHYADIAGQLDGFTRPDGTPVVVAYLTSTDVRTSPPAEHPSKAAARRAVLAGIADGSVDVVVGTHSVVSDKVAYHDLGLLVVDEQQRFGAELRSRLVERDGYVPDVLQATATLPPRTQLMTTFADMPTSVLDEYPAGRRDKDTLLVPSADVSDPADPTWALVRREVAAGRQAFVVAPLVASGERTNEKQSAAAAHDLAEALSAGALAGLRLAVVTGKDKPAERDVVMRAMAAGEVDVLVATTVIETGVNVPNATVIVVVDADRFGISQLHQLRGRVGRGDHPGFCRLVSGATADDTVARLRALESCNDGFRLAELDLEVRGGGQLAGREQSGRQSGLRVADLARDTQLLEWAKADARAVVASDPDLSGHPMLRAELEAVVGAQALAWLGRA